MWSNGISFLPYVPHHRASDKQTVTNTQSNQLKQAKILESTCNYKNGKGMQKQNQEQQRREKQGAQTNQSLEKSKSNRKCWSQQTENENQAKTINYTQTHKANFIFYCFGLFNVLVEMWYGKFYIKYDWAEFISHSGNYRVISAYLRLKTDICCIVILAYTSFRAIVYLAKHNLYH